MGSLFAPALNLGILLAILFYYLKGPFKNYVQSRHTLIRNDLGQVRELLRVAQERYEEFSAKLKAVDVEIASVRERSQQEAEQLRGRIVSHAKQAAGSILIEAKFRAESLVSESRDQLRAELGQNVVNQAERLIQNLLTGDDRARIRREFSQRVGSAL